MTIFFLVFGWVVRAFGSLTLGSYVLVHNLVVLVHVGFAVYAIYYAYKGEMRNLPLFGKFAKQLDF
jgi:uncharacterized membrane protein